MENKCTRLYPEECKAAYERTGLKPTRKIFTDDGACCGIMVGLLDKDPQATAASAARFYGHAYMWGFVAGFDGGDPVYFFKPSNAEERSRVAQGVIDGKNSWEAVQCLL